MNTVRKAFYFFSDRYATRFHIAKLLRAQGWSELNSPDGASFTDQNLILDDETSKHFEHKHLLAALVAKHCPEVMPLTYSIDDDTAQTVIAKLIYDNYLIDNTYQENNPRLKWILKPALLNNADNIVLFNDPQAIKAHFQSTDRLGGPHVIQQYITNPALIDGRKFTFRLHVVMTNYAGVFMVKDDYLNISSSPFTLEDNLANRKAHITNYVLDGEFANIEQRLLSSLHNCKEIYEQMSQIVQKTIKALLKRSPTYLSLKKIKAFEIFGYDFILDDQGKLWLLEINQAPDAPTFEENWLIEPFWKPFWQNIVDDFVLPIALKQAPKNHYQFYYHVLSPNAVMPLWRRIKAIFGL